MLKINTTSEGHKTNAQTGDRINLTTRQLTINKLAMVDGHATNSANKREI